MKFTLRQLDAFVAVARQESVSRAAESLSLSQSAVSMSVNELEKQFDTRLFDRYGKRLQLNELGRQLLPRAQALLDQGQEIENLLHGADDVGPLRLGATLTIGNYLAPLLLGQFMSGQPEQQRRRVHLEVHNTAAIIRQVANFELDFGLIEGVCQHPDLEVFPWVEDELAVFAGPEHPLAGQGKLSLKRLLQESWIVREPGSGTRQTLESALGIHLAEMKIALELEHTEAIKRAVEAGLGIGCISRLALKEAFRRGSLVELPMPGLDLRRQFHFIIHRQKFRTAGLQRFLELCRQAVAGVERSDQIVLRRADGSVIDYR
ncbi:MAG TPA: LysR family transcriptional regulator [Azospira sp.]|nr:LysR family transcriptional regulator [Azospira sp.]